MTALIIIRSFASESINRRNVDSKRLGGNTLLDRSYQRLQSACGEISHARLTVTSTRGWKPAITVVHAHIHFLYATMKVCRAAPGNHFSAQSVPGSRLRGRKFLNQFGEREMGVPVQFMSPQMVFA